MTSPISQGSKAKMLTALWISSNTGGVLLDRDWTDLWKMPPLKLNGGNSLREIVRVQPRLSGFLTGYYMQGKNVVFVLVSELYKGYYISTNSEIFVAGDFNAWNPFGNDTWRLQPVVKEMLNVWEVSVPKKLVFPPGGKEKPMFKFVTSGRRWLNPPTRFPSVRDERGNDNLYIDPARTGKNCFRFISEKPNEQTNPSTKLIWDEKGNYQETLLQHTHINSRLFSLKPMGAIVLGERTLFRLFAPRATKVVVEFWRGNAAVRERLEMKAAESGVWETEFPKNLDGCFYCYRIHGDNIDNSTHFNPDFEVLDPYARATAGPAGPGIVIDTDKHLPPITRSFHAPNIADLVICEAHLRDLTARAPEFAGKKDLGFKEMTAWIRKNTSYFKRLGVNAVELQPIQQFDAVTRNEYHWGYMTTNFFSPASNYASNPAAGTQLREFRELVETLHNAGITVILDVVYNHVGEPNHLFHIDKNYYFNLDKDGRFSNWSGCGNDFNADNPMCRRLICESLLWMIERYGVDGFRFDLAELIGVPALKTIEQAIHKDHPETILISEPWSFRGHIAYALKGTTYSSWNDGFRDYCAKYVKNQVNIDGFRYFLSGSTDFLTRRPTQTINYTESHDDRCWLDKISECSRGDAENPTAADIRRTRIMFAILLSALGVPMIGEGQDFLRTKHGKNNTYLDGEENALDYNRENRFADFAKYTRRWIKFRLSNLGRLFRQRKRVPATFFRFFPDQTNTAVITVYNNDHSQGLLQYLLMINPRTVPATVQAQALSLRGFRRIANSETFDVSREVPPEPGFARKNGIFTLPPLSVSLWIKEGY